MSIALRKLIDGVLKVATKIKQANGTYIENYVDVGTYKISLQELTDDVSASIYGANIIKTYRITSPYNELENYLFTKLNNTEDNISKYYIFIADKQYKIVSVKSKWVDVELL